MRISSSIQVARSSGKSSLKTCAVSLDYAGVGKVGILSVQAILRSVAISAFLSHIGTRCADLDKTNLGDRIGVKKRLHGSPRGIEEPGRGNDEGLSG
jgi:hypothetical protein